MDRLHIYAFGASLGGLLVFAICVLYDRYRKRDPNYKRKLKLKREYERKITELDRTLISPLDIAEARKEENIINELQVGESLMLRGNLEEATQHFANAISICSNPKKILKTLKTCLDPAIYNMLLNVLVKGNLNSYTSKMYLNDAFQNYPLIKS